MDQESCYRFTLSIDLAPNGIPFGAKERISGKQRKNKRVANKYTIINSIFEGLMIYQDSKSISRRVYCS